MTISLEEFNRRLWCAVMHQMQDRRRGIEPVPCRYLVMHGLGDQACDAVNWKPKTWTESLGWIESVAADQAWYDRARVWFDEVAPLPPPVKFRPVFGILGHSPGRSFNEASERDGVRTWEHGWNWKDEEATFQSDLRQWMASSDLPKFVWPAPSIPNRGG